MVSIFCWVTLSQIIIKFNTWKGLFIHGDEILQDFTGVFTNCNFSTSSKLLAELAAYDVNPRCLALMFILKKQTSKWVHDFISQVYFMCLEFSLSVSIPSVGKPGWRGVWSSDDIKKIPHSSIADLPCSMYPMYISLLSPVCCL